MSLTWHIVRKDLRRMAVPVAVWLALIVAGMVWIRTASPHFVGHIPSEIDTWVSLLRIWGGLLVGAELVLMYLLAGSLVLEDPVIGSNAFWLTRPIGGVRLLGAKLITAVACFVVLPVIALLPVWLSVAVQPAELLGAAMRLATLHAFVVATALAVASLVKTLARFLFATVGLYTGVHLAIAASLTAAPAPAIAGISTPSARFMEVGSVVLLVVVLVLEFVRRLPRQGWVVLIVGMLACGGVAMRLPRSTPALSTLATPATAADRARVSASPSFVRFSDRSRPDLKLSTPAGASFLAPIAAIGADGTTVLGPAMNWGDAAAEQVLQRDHAPSSLPWTLQFPWRFAPKTDELDFVGTLEVWRAHATIVADLPIVVGRAAAGDWGTLRIAAMDQLTTGDRDVYIEEREIEPASDLYRRYVGEFDLRNDRARYFVVGADGELLFAPSVVPQNIVRLNSLEIGYRQFRVGARIPLDGARLVKVLIVPEGRFAMPLQVHGVIETDPRRRAARQNGSPKN